MSFESLSSVQSRRLDIEPVGESHLDALFAINGDDEVTKFLPYTTWQSLDDGRAWLQRMQRLEEGGSGRQFVVVRRADRRVIGGVLLFKYDEGSRRIEIGYVLGREHWGQGYMGEAVGAACAAAIDRLGIRRIEAEVNPSNAASCALLERIGFVREGTLRKRWVAKGLAYDTNIYGLLADDWPRAGKAGAGAA